MVTDIQDDLGATTVAAITDKGGTAEFLHHDVTSEDQWRAVVAATVASLGNATKGGVRLLTKGVASGVLFLASDDSSYMTGTELVIDGGISA